MTQKFTLESKACKSLDETTNKALEKSGENDSKTIKNEKYRSENGCKVDKKSKMNGSRNNISLYSKQRKNKSKEKEKEENSRSKDKDKDKNKSKKKNKKK